MGLSLVAVAAAALIVGGAVMEGKAKKTAARAQAEGLEYQAIAAQQEAQARFKAASFNAETARANEALAREAAGTALEQGRVEELISRIGTKQLIARQTTVLAARGIDVGEGSPVDIVADTAAIGEFEALNIRWNAGQEAKRHLATAYNFGRQANLLDLEGEAALAAGAIESRAAQDAAGSTRKAGSTAQQASLISGAGKAVAAFA